MDIFQPLAEEQVEKADSLDRIDVKLGRKQGLKTGLWAGRAVKIPGPFSRELYDVEFLAKHGIIGETVEQALPMLPPGD